MTAKRALVPAALALAALIGCAGDVADAPPEPPVQAAAPARPWFEESASARGLDFVHDSGSAATGRYFMPEIMVGGAALFDMDGDGDLDAYLVQSGSLLDEPAARPPNRLYRNDGTGAFVDVTAASGAGDRGYGAGVATGDFDNDGDVDLYVTNVGPNVLLANDGAGRFSDVTARAGVGDDGWGGSAAFFDYDRDGDLDLYVCNYLRWSVATKVDCPARFREGLDYCGPKAINRPDVDVLYRNEGDGTFTDVTAEAGIGDTRGTGLGVVCGDFDGDGLEDVFVANDGWPDRLWRNLGDGRFEDVAPLAGCAIDEDGAPKAGMGVTAADIDDDGDLDVMVCNLNAESDSLFLNRGSWFEFATGRMGLAAVSRRFTRFGMAWHDFDNDGVVDLFQANGRVALQETDWGAADPYAEPDMLYRGISEGGLRFVPVEPAGGTLEPLIATGRAAAFGDVNGDGAMDVLVVNRDGPAHLLVNVAPDRGGWLLIRVVDEHGRDAIGARVSMAVGDRRVHRDVRTAYSYLAANDPRIHVGLRCHDRARDVTVTWVDGTVESFGDVEADRVVVLRRGDGAAR